ncbi:Pleckstrin homology domain-containing protein [Crepidotus variabilis]|uniref:Pleckstrin homology domain-containing protein n=1 Tax=Crepidotus variabilis TaxID=179855 RepID=A0A9P6JKC5_9AGAR|nr:Pleckstrin homology domain-containing protein [Crepidotus variabilis]
MHEETVNVTQVRETMSQAILDRRCASVLSRLERIPGFGRYFTESYSSGAQSSKNPVSQLWDLLTLGTPLCYLFDQLPENLGLSRINNSSFDPEQYAANPDRARKRAIALFAIRIREERVNQVIPGCEPFTITDLWDKNSTDGFAKVIRTVIAILDRLFPTAFEAPPSSLTSMPPSNPAAALPTQAVSTSSDAQKTARLNIMNEVLVTERGYVQHLETLQTYSIAAAGVLDEETHHLLFPCIAVKRPVGRICKNPLYLISLIKNCSPSTYPHFDELKRGYEATIRVTNLVNEAMRHAENKTTTELLRSQVEDWNGHDLDKFGELLLDDKLLITKSNADRESHVFLFEKILVCCKEDVLEPTSRFGISVAASEQRKARRFLLKERIFLQEITHMERGLSVDSPPSRRPTDSLLTLWWKQADESGSLTLHFRYETHIERWENVIRQRIGVQRRCSEEILTQSDGSPRQETE